MEDREETSSNYLTDLEKYIEKKRKELWSLKNSISFCDLIVLYKCGGYRDNLLLETIARDSRSAEIRDDAFYVIYNLELNPEKFPRVKNNLEITDALNRIKNSFIFASNDETRKKVENQIEAVERITDEYEKYASGENILGIIDVIENSSLSDAEKLSALETAAIESCKKLEKRKIEQARRITEPVVREPVLDYQILIEQTPEVEESIVNRALAYCEKNNYIIENDDAETKEKRIKLSSLIDYLNTPDCDCYSFENQIGILLYILKKQLEEHKEAEELDDDLLKQLIAEEIEKSLSIGEALSKRLEESIEENKSSSTQSSLEDMQESLLSQNILFLRDKEDVPIFKHNVETFSPSEKEKIINIIKRIQLIPSEVGSKPLIDRWKHLIYAKETFGFSVSYLRLPNNGLLVLDVSRDKEGIFTDARKIDMDYQEKIEEIIYESGTNKDELFAREASKIAKENKGRGGK